ncbi:MAG: ATP-binding protein [Verrucomicrobiota bacterium]
MPVWCVDEAPDGSLWFGTVGGIARYDGRSIEHIPLPSAPLPTQPDMSKSTSVQVTGLLALDNRTILACAENFLILYSKGEWKVVLTSIPGQIRTALLRGKHAVWFYSTKAIWRIEMMNPTSVEKVWLAPSGTTLNTMCVDAEGHLWMVAGIRGQAGNLRKMRVRDGSIDSTPDHDTDWMKIPSPGGFAALTAGQDGRIWYADNHLNSSIQCYDPKTREWTKSEEPESKQNYFSIQTLRDGSIWAGGLGQISAIRDDGPVYYSRDQTRLSAVPLSQIKELSDGRLCVVAGGMGAYLVDVTDKQWQSFTELHFQCSDTSGVDWFIHYGSIVSHDPKTEAWLRYGQHDGTISNPSAVHASSHGLVWVIGKHFQPETKSHCAAFSVFNGQRWQRVTLTDFAIFIPDRSFWEASDGSIWLGAGGIRDAKRAGGALQYQVTSTGEIKLAARYTRPAFPYNIHQFVESRDGRIWIGRAGIHVYTPGSSTAERVQGLPTSQTRGMVVDAEDTVWVAHFTEGIHRNDADGWRRYTATDGLASNRVTGLLMLQDGTLLASTDRGMSRFDGRSWIGNVFSDSFGMSPGYGTVKQSSDGALWMNFTRNDLRSARVSLNLTTPYQTIRYQAEKEAPDTAIIEGFERVAEEGNIQISWEGLDPWENTPRDLLHFSYRLNDGEWSPFTYDTRHTYLNLPSGQHRFQVRARDRDFNLDPTPAQFAFTVAAPFWAQPWFIATLIVIMGATIALIWQYIHFRDKQIEQQQHHFVELEQQKNTFFTNVSHEMNTPITAMSLALHRIHRKEHDPETKDSLTRVLNNLDWLGMLVTQILDFRRLDAGKLSFSPKEIDLAGCIRDTFERLGPIARSKNQDYSLDGPESLIAWQDPDLLGKIVQNLVSNAIKYTPDRGIVRLTFLLKDHDHQKSLFFSIEDSGPGIAPEHREHIFERFYRVPESTLSSGSGIGLHLTHELVQLSGGTIQAESPVQDSEEYPGTRFSLVLPIEKAILSQEFNQS